MPAAQARRVALAAQGFAAPRPKAAPDRRHLRRVLKHTGLLQIDSVNVFQRAHYGPAFSRLGAYPTAMLDRMAYRDRELFEYWGHEAALLPVELHPLMRWRMRRAEQLVDRWGHIAKVIRERPGYIEHVLDAVRAHGPLTAGQLTADEKRTKDNWGWNWSDAKTTLEYLFYAGAVTAADRRNFERVYDVTERVIPQAILDVPTPDDETAHRELLLVAARCHGIGTATDLADYFRLKMPVARPRLAELVEDGRLVEVAVEGWSQPAYLFLGTAMPRRNNARALLVPFDPLIWERARTERLFGFRYRIEIYVPAPKRTHGYYVLPFLLGDRLVARVDLKSDRQARVLRVQSAWAEPDAPAETAAELAAELRVTGNWLGLDDIAVANRGDLAPALAAAVNAR
ncbi:MAG: uncharacterized protein QOC82_994 [Frankiaceae bacterium]|nr:uncharacterized protein [Frankiaceae bacterium]